MKFILLAVITFINLVAFDAFITPSELKNSLNNKELIILDVDTKEIYKAGHIKNALHVDMSKFTDIQNRWLMASSEEIEYELSQLGLNSDSYVVIYTHNTEKSILNSSYLALALIRGGFENLSILDGGYMSWIFEYEFLVSSEANYPENDGNIKLNERNIIVDLDYVKSYISKLAMLDARSTMEYFGVEKSQGIKAIGHIPKAKSSYYKNNFLKDGTLRDKEEIEQIYINGLELQQEDEIVVYGDTIFSASMEWYILYKYLNFKNTKIYEKSFMEWGNLGDSSITRFKWE